MPDRRTPTAEQRSAALVKDAATQAVEMALSGHEKATEAAVARALRDQQVDGALREHQRRLDAINGSQTQMARELGRLAESSSRQVAVSEALAEAATRQAGARLSKRAFVMTVLGVIAAYLAVLIPLVYLLAQR